MLKYLRFLTCLFNCHRLIVSRWKTTLSIPPVVLAVFFAAAIPLPSSVYGASLSDKPSKDSFLFVHSENIDFYIESFENWLMNQGVNGEELDKIAADFSTPKDYMTHLASMVNKRSEHVEFDLDGQVVAVSMELFVGIGIGAMLMYHARGRIGPIVVGDHNDICMP